MLQNLIWLQCVSASALAVALATACFAARLAAHLRVRPRPWHPRSGECVVAVGALAAALSAGISVLRPHLPEIHDEFSYLLASDTFTHGRLTNPPHPMWRHFETFHVMQQPTYASKYPPGQGLALALGQALSGSPNLGLWISVGLAAGGVCWMVQGWMPRRWALWGGGLIAFHASIQLVWSQNYWGGNVALFGGSLVLGAYPRLRRAGHPRDAIWMAVGLAILANTRPFEGFVVSIPLAAAMAGYLLGQSRSSLRLVTLRVVLPLCLCLALVTAWMGYYNFRVTGRASQMPYQVYEAAYAYLPPIQWQSPAPAPDYRHEVMRRFYLEFVPDVVARQQTWSGFLNLKGTQLLFVFLFLVPLPLAIPLLALPAVVRKRRYWLPDAMLVAGVVGLLAATWIFPHYAAPAVAALFLLILQCLRHVRLVRWRGKRIGVVLVRGILISQVLAFLVMGARHILTEPVGFPRERANVLERLREMPGRHLVVVKYSRNVDFNHEWVYNEAEIDAAKVVWARSINAAADRQLLRYFADRRAWLLMVDGPSARLAPYAQHPTALLHQPRTVVQSSLAGSARAR